MRTNQSRRTVRTVALALAVVGVLVAAGCQPVTHPAYTSRKGPTSAVTFVLLSGNGRYVVVTSTGPDGSVPGAGTWRIDRTTGALDALPTSGAPTDISYDGSIVLIGSGPTLWVDGTETTAPPDTVFSEDLAFGVFRDAADGRIKTWRVADGAIAEVETQFPRPSGVTFAIPRGVSNDGNVVRYTLGGIERFADVGAGIAHDEGTGSATEFALAGDGSAMVHLIRGAGTERVQLVELPSGNVAAEYVNTSPTEHLQLVRIGLGGRVAWAYQSASVPDGTGPCPAAPLALSCVVTSSLISISPDAVRVRPLGARSLAQLELSWGGDYALIEKYLDPYGITSLQGGVGVYHESSDTWSEGLAAGETYTEQGVACAALFLTPPCTMPGVPAAARISADGTLIAARTISGSGWSEFAVAPAP